MNLLNKTPEETISEFKKRLYVLKLRDNLFTWDEIVQAVNDVVLPQDRRKRDAYSREAHRLLSEGLLDMDNYSVSEAEENIMKDDILTAIRKERYKLSEERIQNNAYIRKLAREDTLKEIADNFAKEMSSKKILDIYDTPLYLSGSREGILCLSDWHYGIVVNNYFNKYDPQICINRVKELTKRVIDIGKLHNIRTLHIVNLSDLICGRIHLTLRLESREDIISQTMSVSEILAEMLTTLSRYFTITYRDCLDNHSRLEPNKKDSLELETMVRIIPWYLKSRLKDNRNIDIIDNEYADDIIAFETLGHSVVAVHGHKDKLDKVIDNMTHMTRQRNELILTGHFHHFSADENHECLRLSNGSLMGVDQYANDLRLTSKPSQNMIIVSEDDVTEAIYKIKLDIQG
nr:MAG TPA: DNA polymerase II small subunit [Caudoviricetes sp.]